MLTTESGSFTDVTLQFLKDELKTVLTPSGITTSFVLSKGHATRYARLLVYAMPSIDWNPLHFSPNSIFFTPLRFASVCISLNVLHSGSLITIVF